MSEHNRHAPNRQPAPSHGKTDVLERDQELEDLEASFLLSPDDGAPHGPIDVEKVRQQLNPPDRDNPDADSNPNEPDSKFHVVVVGLDRNIRAHAIEEANRVLHEKTAGEGFIGILKNLYKGKGIKGKFRHIPKNIAEAFRQTVHGNLAREVVLGNEFTKAQKAIIENQNLLIHEGGEVDDYRLATLYRFGEAADQYEELVQAGAGEKRLKVSLDTNEKDPEDLAALQAKKLVRGLMEKVVAGAYDDPATGAFNRDAFNEDEKALMAEFGQDPALQEYIGKGQVWAANFYEMGMAIKAHFSTLRAKNPNAKFDEVLNNTVVYLGEAQVGAHTESERGLRERIMDQLSRTPLANEGVILTAVTTTLAAASWFTKRTLGAAVAAAGALGVGGGLVAGLRAANATRQERVFRTRRQTRGEQDPMAGEGLYEAKKATDLMQQLNLLYDEETGEFRMDDPQAAMQIIAETTARLRLSARRKDDLISFDLETEDGRKPADQRMDLTIALSKAKVDLRKILADAIAAGDDDVLRSFGMTDEALSTVKAAQDPLEAVLEPVIAGNEGLLTLDILGEINQDIKEKDAVHRKLMGVSALKGFAAGTIAGLSLGILSQEVVASWINKQNGVLNNHKGAPHQTLLRRGIDNAKNVANKVLGRNHETITLAASVDSVEVFGQSEITLENNLTIAQNGSNFVVNGPNGLHVEGISLTAGGNLTDESVKLLNANGVHVATSSPEFIIPPAGPPTEAKVTGAEWAALHQDDMTKVSRNYMDNGTPMYRDENGKLQGANLNERRLDRPFIQPDGTITINMGRMREGDSFNKSGAVDWNNERKIAFTLTDDTTDQVILRDVDENGSADITPDDPLYKLFRKDSPDDKNPSFTGKWYQGASDRGVNAQGVTQLDIMATVIGEKQKEFTTIIQDKPEPVPVTPITLTYEQPTDVLVPPIVPIYSRRGLDLAPTPKKSPGGYEYGAISGERIAGWSEERSPRLRENPSADLNTGEELRWYRDQQLIRRGQAYLNEIDGYITQNDVLLKMGAETKALVCIPVAGASEADNIYNTLSLYAQQTVEAQNATMVFLHVNWPERFENDPDQMAKVQKTLSEIERARADFPYLRIASFEKTWSEEFIDSRNGKIYGEVIKVLYDTAAFAVEQSIRDGRRSDDDQAILMTNDADVNGMSRRYLENYLSAADRHPDTDIFSGAIRWGTDVYKDYPGYGVSSYFYSMMNIVFARDEQKKKIGEISTTGPNAAFRLSAFAAVGGCEDSPNVGAGADYVLGVRVSSARRVEQNEAATNANGMPGGSGIPAVTALSTGTTATPAPTNRQRPVGYHVPGAQVDTFGDRLLGAYRRNDWMANGWGGFDTGGYQDRSVSASAGTIGPENPATDIDSIADRVETNIKGFVNYWYRDAALTESALKLTFGDTDAAGQPLYSADWTDGNFSFSFTPEGKKFLQERLLNDMQSNPDTYGERLRRQLYNEGTPRSRVNESLFVQPSQNATPSRSRIATPPVPSQPVPSSPTPAGPVAKILPPSPEQQAQLNTLRKIESEPGLSVVEADLIVDGHPFKGEMVFERIDPDEGDYVFMPLNNRSGDTWFALGADELMRALGSGKISLKK